MPNIILPPEVAYAQEDLARVGVALASFHAIAVGRIYPQDVQAVAINVAERAIRLGLDRAQMLLDVIEHPPAAAAPVVPAPVAPVAPVQAAEGDTYGAYRDAGGLPVTDPSGAELPRTAVRQNGQWVIA